MHDVHAHEVGKFKWIDHESEIARGTLGVYTATAKTVFIASMMSMHRQHPVLSGEARDVTCPSIVQDM